MMYLSFDRSYRVLPDAFSKNRSKLDHELQYCNFILKYADHFEKRFTKQCEDWMVSYLDYQKKLQEYEKQMEDYRLQKLQKEQDEQDRKDKKAEEEFQKIINAPVEKEAKNHILRNS